MDRNRFGFTPMGQNNSNVRGRGIRPTPIFRGNPFQGHLVRSTGQPASHYPLSTGQSAPFNPVPTTRTRYRTAFTAQHQVHHSGEYKPLENPYRDCARGMKTTQEELLKHVSCDEMGMERLKAYVDIVDMMDNKGGQREGDKVSKDRAAFCQQIRESSLQVFEDYMRLDPRSFYAGNGKLYLLQRLKKYSELLRFCDSYSASIGKRVKHIELKKIEALKELRLFDDAFSQLLETECKFGFSKETGSLTVSLHVAKGNFDKARELLNELKSEGKINENKFESFLKWIDLSQRDYDKEAQGALHETIILSGKKYILNENDNCMYQEAVKEYEDKNYSRALYLLNSIQRKYMGIFNEEVDSLCDRCREEIK